MDHNEWCRTSNWFFFFTIILLRINLSYFTILCYMVPSSSNTTAPVPVLPGTSETVVLWAEVPLFLVAVTARWRVSGSHFGHLGPISHTEGRACRRNTTDTEYTRFSYLVWVGCTQLEKYFISITMQKLTNVMLHVIDLNRQNHLANNLFFFASKRNVWNLIWRPLQSVEAFPLRWVGFFPVPSYPLYTSGGRIQFRPPPRHIYTI